jgi:hypothetical protein
MQPELEVDRGVLAERPLTATPVVCCLIQKTIAKRS